MFTDFRQIELRLLGHLANDPLLIELSLMVPVHQTYLMH